MTDGTELLWAVRQRVMVISYRRFGRSYLKGLRIQEGRLKYDILVIFLFAVLKDKESKEIRVPKVI